MTATTGAPPEWSTKAIWYQIFVERFHNGDPSNDPRPEWMQGSYPGYIPDKWEITPWDWDWYRPDPWAESIEGGFHRWVAARRYGGDLQGVLNKLEYLEQLGITAIYFNPLYDSPSLHKYDARHYRHIDRTFGPDPEGDTQLMLTESPADPSTWKWTTADRLFLQLIEQIHRRGMKLILDVSWNHTGNTFWAWQDLLKNQQKSRYRDWYDIQALDDPETDENEFAYEGWLGVKTLPELRKVAVRDKRDGYPFEGDLDPSVKDHVLEVTRRWLDPNQDGDPSDGVDGFRLDVAAHVPLGFWRDYRNKVKAINPDALLLGEAWWTDWPDTLMDPRPFLQGDTFDSVMHYQWYRPARKFFAQANGGISAEGFIKAIQEVYHGYDQDTQQGLMNLVASHDSPRFATSFANHNPYKFQMGAAGNPSLHVGPPSAKHLARMQSMLLHQFSFLSAPHIWAGDELGMWGADDPDCRKPIIWPEMTFQDESYRPDGTRVESIPVRANLELMDFIRQLTLLRKKRSDWLSGDVTYHSLANQPLVLAYERFNRIEHSLMVFNASDQSCPVSLPVEAQGTPKVVFQSQQDQSIELDWENKLLNFELPAYTGLAIDLPIP